MNTLVGSIFGSSRLEANDIPDHLVWTQLEKSDFDEGVFATEFERLYEWLVRDHEAYTVIAPLAGLVLEGESIQLADDAEIARMTDEEVIACLGFRLLQSMGSADFALDCSHRCVSSVISSRVDPGSPTRIGIRSRIRILRKAAARRLGS